MNHADPPGGKQGPDGPWHGGDGPPRRHLASRQRQRVNAGTVTGPDDVEVLVAAAWLHDVGYAPRLRDNGSHSLDGALHLRGGGWPARIAYLMHTVPKPLFGRVRGLPGGVRRLARADSTVADALTYADQTVGPPGRSVDFEDRVGALSR